MSKTCPDEDSKIMFEFDDIRPIKYISCCTFKGIFSVFTKWDFTVVLK